ncbi:MAG: hypothetical protein PHD76_04485 [Methylacidiphilales bacterium]|nr:hypothetical protein [Candidatus Methylacidiphilales bacterium]
MGVGFACLSLALTAAAGDKDFGRDPEAIYFSDLGDQKPIILKVEKVVGVYADRNLSAYMRNFQAGDDVQLLAYNPDAYFVRHLKSGYEGWVAKENLSKIDKDQLDTLLARVEEERKFADAIKRKEVLPGMTFDHVKAALGKPTSKTFRQDENGRFDKWSYIDYETRYVSQPYFDSRQGAYVNLPVAIKVAVGSLNVEFKSGRVTAIERTRDKNAGAN